MTRARLWRTKAVQVRWQAVLGCLAVAVLSRIDEQASYRVRTHDLTAAD
jgi:hypothetical protein